MGWRHILQPSTISLLLLLFMSEAKPKMPTTGIEPVIFLQESQYIMCRIVRVEDILIPLLVNIVRVRRITTVPSAK